MRDIQFVAGFFDADGCCSIRHNRQISCLFHNDNVEVLEEIQRIIGGKERTINPKKKPKGGITHTLTVSDRETLFWLVPELSRYCIVKREKLKKAYGILDDIQVERLLNLGAPRPWTEDENNTIKNTTDKTANEVSQILRTRTKIAVEQRRKTLRVKSTRLPQIAWTEDEDTILRENTDKTAKAVSQILERRTEGAIKQRRSKIGVKSTRLPTGDWKPL